ncbi:polyribonucleotide nucleotidyltransferase [Caedimonas varicaedens]|uniref:Polyribonucleotide nucleotidyltransferase n=1 Tax=Caedimonas varicaedens TaxID=1629334 RepID=A0A0K8MC20_9PROT|nr:polyribonucleotide nucleotidyltransferase [Caedimonas varicaedens]
MFNISKKEINWGGRTLTLETGRIARQADGAVLATYGETSVLCTVVAQKIPRTGIDFLPLTIHFQEKSFAAGKIPGGYFKREGKPSEKEVLTSRLIDRPIRPLFPHGFHNEVQVVCTLLSHDLENDPDIVAIIGASAAISLSGVPFEAPLAAARVGFKDGEYLLNPTFGNLASSQLDLVVAGTVDGVLMVESEAQELSEETMLGAVMFGYQSFQPVIKMIKDLVKDAGKSAWDIEDKSAEEKKLYAKVKKKAEKELRAAYALTQKAERHTTIDKVKASVLEALVDEETSESQVQNQLKALEQEIVRGDILSTGYRIDGRDTKTIRPIMCEAGFLPRTHGSALFTRGETQAIVVATLGTAQDEQIIDALSGEGRERFMLHYNFPPYSVGEVGRLASPGRREIGHGKLAWRALHPLMPSKDKFPYTVRIVSEITESNGSSSMATVCGSSLCMMDAGIPLERPVAGIAMGLIKEGNKVAILSDILGDEDHLGDMDFKVAGTDQGVTALQMDLKITSITEEIMKQALTQARDGRFHILGEMAKSLNQSRATVSENAPRIVSIQIAKEKIRELIGPGGKVIREICETTGTKIDISEDGKVDISGMSQAAIDAALERVRMVAAEPEIGQIYKGTVAKIMDFGAFVNYMGERSGLVHISQLAAERVGKVEDVVKVGDTVYIKFIGFDDRGKAKLSMKMVDQNSGQEIQS